MRVTFQQSELWASSFKSAYFASHKIAYSYHTGKRKGRGLDKDICSHGFASFVFEIGFLSPVSCLISSEQQTTSD